MTTTRTWTKNTFICQACKQLCYAAAESIKGFREELGTDPKTTDAEIAASFDYCLGCCDGVAIEGEKVRCQGMEDEKGEAACEGRNVRRFVAEKDGGTIIVDWCLECCSLAAVRDGWKITSVISGEAFASPVVVTRTDLARAFTEWERRYRESPDQFWSDAQRASESPATYGEACAPYFIEIINGLQSNASAPSPENAPA